MHTNDAMGSAHAPPVASNSLVTDGRVKVTDVNAKVVPTRESRQKDVLMLCIVGPELLWYCNRMVPKRNVLGVPGTGVRIRYAWTTYASE